MVHKKNKTQRGRVEVATLYADQRDVDLADQLKNGLPVEEKSNDQLFVVSKKPEVIKLSKKEMARSKITHAERVLMGNDNVQVLSKGPVPTKQLTMEGEKIKKMWAKNNRQAEKPTKQVVVADEDDDYMSDLVVNGKKRKATGALKDLWATPKPHGLNEFTTTEVIKPVYTMRKHKPIVAGKKAVELPHPGMSYRPDSEEHNLSLHEAVKVEMVAQRYVDKVNKRLKVPDEEYYVADKNKVHDPAEDSECETDDSDIDSGKINYGKLNSINERVTRKEKNKKARRAAQYKLERIRLLNTRQKKHIDASEQIVDKLIEKEEKLKVRHINRAIDKEEKTTMTKKIGRHAVALENEPYLLKDELPSSLKNLSNIPESSREKSYSRIWASRREACGMDKEADVDVLSEKLGKQLSTLETEMVVGILDSTMGVSEVVSQLGDKDQMYLTDVTAWIDYYNNQLRNMKKYIEHIESKNNKMNVVSSNQKKLMESLKNLLSLLTLEESTIVTLNNPDFVSPDGLKAAIKAATDLRKALTTKLKAGMDHMVAVKDQRKVFETYKLSFSRRVALLIEKEFKMSDANKDYQQGDNELPEHTGYFDLLNRYKPLVHWLKQLDVDKFHPLIPLYIKSYRSNYKHEIKPFISSIQHNILKETKDQNEVTKAAAAAPTTPVSAKNQKKRTIDAAFRYCLSCLETSVMDEQKFLMDFFLFSDPPTHPRPSGGGNGDHHRHHRSMSSSSKDKLTVAAVEGLENPLDTILSEMFDCIIPELKEMVEKADQINPFYLLTMLIDTESYISVHATIGPEYSSFIVKVLSEVQKTMKTLFNKFIDLQADSIKSTTHSLKRCGVLAHFKHFPVIVSLYGWMDGLVEKMPPDDKYRTIAKLENYYYLTTKMEEIGIACLKNYRETSLGRFKENLEAYTNLLIDLKFKTLFDFYSKMDELLLTLPPSDIQFQGTHSKQQYKKIVERYKTESIEKGLLKALTNIYKHITKDSTLILVIWNHLEEVLIGKYEHFQELTQQCYGQAMPVTADQIMGIFVSVLKKNPNK
eukprot:gene16834-20018_t